MMEKRELMVVRIREGGYLKRRLENPCGCVGYLLELDFTSHSMVSRYSRQILLRFGEDITPFPLGVSIFRF